MTTEQKKRPEGAHCAACDRPLTACWRFREDDKHCGLCGEQVLRLVLGHSDADGRTWLYRRPGKPLYLMMSWEFGCADRKVKTRRRPVIDLAGSSALVQHDELGGEQRFELRPGPAIPDKPKWVAAQLVPRFSGFDQLALPPGGVAMWLDVATGCGTERRKAVLLPHADPLLSWQCADPSIHLEDGVWQVYQKGKAVAIPCRLSASVRACVLGLRKQTDQPTSDDVEVVGFERPVELLPGRPYRFELRVNNQAWAAREPVPFHFVWATTAGQAVPPQGHVAFFEGRRLEVRGVDLREQVQLGEVITPTLGLTASEDGPADEPAIEVRGYEVRRDPDRGDWLRVVYPTREELALRPLTVLPPGADRKPQVVRLEIDTTRLGRAEFDGRPLHGHVEFIDSRMRRWSCALHVTANRPERLDHDVAIDWGTTNTCAAYSLGVGRQAPVPVRFMEGQPSPERFPSDIYFVDVSDPDNPIILTGEHASQQGKVHPECLLRSVKRKFQFRERVTVLDERQRHHTYEVRQVVLLLLHRLISQAEVVQGREMRLFGLTFPTKWSPRVRQLLEGVTRELARQLGQERRPLEVEVLPPLIDEANAVALNLLTAQHGRKLPERFFLIAYDFGGGTVDTSVLEVSFRGGRLATRYVGIGGRPDFGGDDVTRAVLMLLRDKLMTALRRRDLFKGPRVLDIPLVADGEPLRDSRREGVVWYQVGRGNWDVLWTVAEFVKKELCNARAPGGAGAPQLAGSLMEQGNKIS
jgi:hypothetical protein